MLGAAQAAENEARRRGGDHRCQQAARATFALYERGGFEPLVHVPRVEGLILALALRRRRDFDY
jgi:hypothetical protein